MTSILVLIGMALLLLPFICFFMILALRSRVSDLNQQIEALRRGQQMIRDSLTGKSAAKVAALSKEEGARLDAEERDDEPETPPIPAPRRAPEVRAPAPAPAPVRPMPVPVTPRVPAPRPTPPRAPSPPLIDIDWESFTGAKLFAWIGGLALFLAAAFFVKYSIDRDLIPPAVRLAVGALLGFGLILSSFRLDPKRYATTLQTLASGGVGILYTVVFAATLLYGYLPKPAGFGLLCVVTAASFALSVRHKGVAVAVLAAVGAYLTPVLVNTGQGSLLGLAAYLCLVDAGLVLVQKRLGGLALLATAVFGSSLVLLMAQSSMHAPDWQAALAWSLHSALLLGLLWNSPEPDQAEYAGPLALIGWIATLIAAVMLLQAPGPWPLLLVTVALLVALALGSKSKAWAAMALPASATTFLLALAWAWVQPVAALQSPEASLALFAYGLVGCLGPVFLLYKHGQLATGQGWLRGLPLAVLACFATLLLRSPAAHWIFWPLLLGLGLIALTLCVIIGAFFQGILLILGLFLGGAWWLSQTHLAFDLGFFLFLLVGAVAVLGLLAWLALGRAQALQAVLKAARGGKDQELLQGVEAEALMVAPVLGFFALLGFSFVQKAASVPLMGMAVLLAFLLLCLGLASRKGFRSAGLAALLGAAVASSLWMAQPASAELVTPVLLWALGLFAVGLIAPWFLWMPAQTYPALWIGAAFFEALFGLYAVRAADALGDPLYNALPLLLALFKLPLVARLLQSLKKEPSRNSLLAAHGGSLLFYLSCLPVLYFEGGWAGLTFTTEALALLWLNRRIPHPGLRWTALIMAPVGAYYVAMHLPDLRGVAPWPLINPGYLALVVATGLLLAARRLAIFPEPSLQGWPWAADDDKGPRLDPAAIFRSYAAIAGLLLLQWGLCEGLEPQSLLGMQTWAQGLGGEETRFFVPWAAFIGHSLEVATASGLLWVAYGTALLLSPATMRRSLRGFALALLSLGSLKLALTPMLYRADFGALLPVLNAPSFALLVALGAWGLLFYRQGGTDWPLKDVPARAFAGVALTGLAFWFMNVQIASIFKGGGEAFSFGHGDNLARQLAFSLGSLAFGVALLALGLTQRVKALRMAGLVLLSLASLKVFLGDLWSLGQLYRVASLVGLAVVLILASFLYQKFEKEGA